MKILMYLILLLSLSIIVLSLINFILPSKDNDPTENPVLCINDIKISNTENYCTDEYSNRVYQQALTFKINNDADWVLYKTNLPNKDGVDCLVGSEKISKEIELSPNCSQVVYKVTGYESTNYYFVNLDTQQTIAQSNNNTDSGQDFGYIEDIKWSDNGEYFILVEYPNLRGGLGKRAVYVGDSKGNIEVAYTKNDNFGNFTLHGEIYGISINNKGIANFNTKFSTEDWWQEGPLDEEFEQQGFDSQFSYNYTTKELKKL